MRMRNGMAFLVLALAATTLGGVALAQAGDSRFEIGPRVMLVTAGGEPSNDLMGGGIFGRYRLSDKWLVGVAVDSIGGDFELPNQLVGVTTPEVYDAKMDLLIVSGWAEREYGKKDARLRWFWTAGLGFSSPDVTDVAGLTSDGGTFDITTDPGSEIVATVSGGLRRALGRRWAFEAALRLDHHFADWTVTDRDSGQTGTVSDYTAKGLHVAFTYRF